MNQLTCLMNDESLKQELAAYNGALQRLKIRLRNNLLIAQLKQVVRISKELRRNFSRRLLMHGDLKGKKLIKFVKDLILFADKSLDKMLQVYSYTQAHMRIGHLIQHLILVRTSLARVRICFKAILVYAADIYRDLKPDNQKVLTFYREILEKNDCKPLSDSNKMAADQVDRQEEEHVGQLIDRSAFESHMAARSESTPKPKKVT